MKENLMIRLMKLRLTRPIRVWGLLMGLMSVAVFFLVFQARSPSSGQETKKTPPFKNAPPVSQEPVPNYEQQLPFFVTDCNERNEWIYKEVRFFVLHNPYFVRGDFDGDGGNDYAITVESLKDKRQGLLICFNNPQTKPVLLGLDSKNPPPFWRLLDWDVQNPAQIAEITDLKGNPVGIKPKGEAIVMYWEDSIGVIYWDGKEFQWKLVILNDG